MPRFYIGLIATKSQMGTNTPTVAASGSSRSGVKTTTASSVNDATHSYGWLMSILSWWQFFVSWAAYLMVFIEFRDVRGYRHYAGTPP